MKFYDLLAQRMYKNICIYSYESAPKTEKWIKLQICTHVVIRGEFTLMLQFKHSSFNRLKTVNDNELSWKPRNLKCIHKLKHISAKPFLLFRGFINNTYIHNDFLPTSCFSSFLSVQFLQSSFFFTVKRLLILN
jgi:hypothetical protein